MLTYENCRLCPRQCAVDRSRDERGFCKMPGRLTAARAMLHYGEEPCLCGDAPTGAVFFSGCTLRCAYCQNAEISLGCKGQALSPQRLREIFLELIEAGASSIDLVTPTQFLPDIVPALYPKLPVPVIYNCGGYERPETIARLDGLVDTYLPDMKYADGRLAAALSQAPDYFPVAAAAIREMVRQTGPVQWQGEKVVKGTIIRHLILPGCVENSLKVLDWIGDTFSPGEVLVSLMRQYTPMGGLSAPFDRPITEEEYDSVLSWMYLNDLEGFTQESSAADKTFIPDF